MERRKQLVLATAIGALLFLVGAAIYCAAQREVPALIDPRGHPSIGTGAIHLVIFEDFLCPNCRAFTEEILPHITTRYIETGLARYTMVPLAFLEGSKPLANAALGVYAQAPNQFLPFVQEVLRKESLQTEKMLLVAHRIGGIDLDLLAECIERRLYYDALEGNLHWAKKLMGAKFGTPALFINGIPTATTSFEEIASRIDQLEVK